MLLVKKSLWIVYQSIFQIVSQPEFEDTLEVFCNFVRKQLKRATMEKFELERESSHPPVPVPYQFLTPKVLIF